MTVLTIEQVFGDTPLDGRLPLQPSFSPDGRMLVYLKQSADNKQRLDLWQYNMEEKTSHELVNVTLLPALFFANISEPTQEEKAEAERKRMFSSGITTYLWHPSSEAILFPVQGALYIFNCDSKTCKQITPANTRQTDFGISPTGDKVSYVRSGDLYICDIQTLGETRLTDTASETLTNGIADFIAQEEMHRFEGYWWSPDGNRIAYTQVDTSNIPESQRYEINADEFVSFSQRYPYAGGQNAQVKLAVITLNTRQTLWINYAIPPSNPILDDQQAPYLARINFTPDSENLFLQVQSRDQQVLTLCAFDIHTESLSSILTEHQPTWINLHNNLRFLSKADKVQKGGDGSLQFVWSSERSGRSQLYLYYSSDMAVFECKQITRELGRVNRVVGTNGDDIYFEGWRESPTEQHLYVSNLKLAAPARQLTEASGWHEVFLNKDCSQYIDRHSNLQQPASLFLNDISPSNQEIIADNRLGRASKYSALVDHHSTAVLGELKAADKQTLHYRLTQPTECKPGQTYPIIVHVYGGPGVQRVKNEWCPLTLQLFAQAGFGVFELDNRGSSNREKKFEDPIYMQLGKIEVEDQLRGVDFLKTLSWVDPSRIGVFGHSYGGYMTLKCIEKAPGIFKAGVAVAPVTDWRLYDTHYTERYLGIPADNTEGYTQSNIVPLKKQLQSELLIIHGMSDDNVLFTHSTKLFKALQDQNATFQMMTYPGAKHALQETSVVIHRYHSIFSFFKRAFSDN